MIENLRRMQLCALPEVRFFGDFDEEHISELAQTLLEMDQNCEVFESLISGVVGTGPNMNDEEIQQKKIAQILFGLCRFSFLNHSLQRSARKRTFWGGNHRT